MERNKRLIAVVTNRKRQVIYQELVKQGMAWHFKRYSKDITYANLEANAKKIG